MQTETAAAITAIENGARHVALTTAQRVMAGIRARVRFRTGQLRNRVAMKENAAQREFVVGFLDASEGGGDNAMLPVWQEFGTQKLRANPAVGDAVNAERGSYESQMRAVVGGAIEKVSR